MTSANMTPAGGSQTRPQLLLPATAESARNAGFSADNNAAGPSETCPYASKPTEVLPCDADHLRVENVADKQAVECALPAGRDTSLSPQQRSLLGSDDLLLQAVADYHHHGDYDEDEFERYDPAKMKKARIVVSGRITPSCPTQRHRFFEMTPGDPTMPLLAVNSTNQAIEMLAPSVRLADGGGSFLAGFWPFGKHRVGTRRVYLNSCAVRPGAEPVSALSARIEIWPKDEYELKYTLPPFVKVTKSVFSGKDGFTGEHLEEMSRQIEAVGNKYSEEIKHTHDAAKDMTKEERKVEEIIGGLQTRTETKSASDQPGVVEQTITAADHAYGLGRGMQANRVASQRATTLTDYFEVTPAISFKRNGTELDLTETLNSIIAVYTGVKSAFDGFMDAVPKVGWQYDFKFSLLEGSISGKWGTQPKAAPSHPRIWEVETFYAINVDVKVLYVKWELGFGISLIPSSFLGLGRPFELVAKVDISLAGEAALKKTFSSANPSDEPPEPITAQIKARGGATGKAKVLGHGVEFEMELTGGIEISGTATCSRAEPLVFWMEGHWSPVAITLRCDGPWRGAPVVKELFRYPATGRAQAFSRRRFPAAKVPPPPREPPVMKAG